MIRWTPSPEPGGVLGYECGTQPADHRAAHVGIQQGGGLTPPPYPTTQVRGVDDDILPPLAPAMSFRQMELALDAPVTNAQFRILMLLASYAHDDGTNARPGIDRLVMRSGMSERSVQEALAGLREAGLIEAIAYEHGGRKHTTEYRLNLQTPQQSAPIEPRFSAPFYSGKGARKRKPSSQRVQISAAKGAENRSERVRKTAPKGAETRTPICHESVSESVNEPGNAPRSPQRGARSAATPPPSLVAFDALLKQCKGYCPGDKFFEKIVEKYMRLDLDEEGLKIADWLSRHPKREASDAFVLGWLGRAHERQPAPRNGSYSNGHVNGSPLSRTQATAADLARSRDRPNSVAITDEMVRNDPEIAKRLGIQI